MMVPLWGAGSLEAYQCTHRSKSIFNGTAVMPCIAIIYHIVTFIVHSHHHIYIRSVDSAKETYKDWNILMKFSTLAALEVVILTYSSAPSDEHFVKMTTFLFQCNNEFIHLWYINPWICIFWICMGWSVGDNLNSSLLAVEWHEESFNLQIGAARSLIQ